MTVGRLVRPVPHVRTPLRARPQLPVVTRHQSAFLIETKDTRPTSPRRTIIVVTTYVSQLTWITNP
jgi:hypothetical protein